jgi:hypothetical protein
MTAQLVILAFGALVFVLVAWFDRWQERRRQPLIELTMTLDSSELTEGLRRAGAAIAEASKAFDQLTPAMHEAGAQIERFGRVLGDTYEQERE